jgi:ubiquinone biosynthesis protein Coq4
VVVSFIGGGNKGNNKITELRTILQRENKVYKQTKSVNNRKTVKTVMKPKYPEKTADMPQITDKPDIGR